MKSASKRRRGYAFGELIFSPCRDDDILMHTTTVLPCYIELEGVKNLFSFLLLKIYCSKLLHTYVERSFLQKEMQKIMTAGVNLAR